MTQSRPGSETEFVESSGNVFADLGLPNPELRQLKADVALKIQEAIESKGLDQKEAAVLMGLDKQKVSNIVCGRLGGYTLDRLFRCLTALDVDVSIRMRPKPKKRSHAELRTI